VGKPAGGGKYSSRRFSFGALDLFDYLREVSEVEGQTSRRGELSAEVWRGSLREGRSIPPAGLASVRWTYLSTCGRFSGG
jgi:hypothetical protein